MYLNYLIQRGSNKPRGIMECGMIITLLLILTAILSTAYDRKCPEPSQWQLYAREICSVARHYKCLLRLHSTANSSLYEELCDEQNEEGPLGGKFVLRPTYDFVECHQHRYQPFKFTADGNSDCVYQKSKCDEDGQVVFNNGTVVRDTFCRCDFKNEYTFVTKPKNVCYCIPSEEDCSCYKTKCLPGFKCNENTLLNFATCEQNETTIFTEFVTVFYSQYEHHENILPLGQNYRIICAGIILGIICIPCTIGITLNVRKYVEKPKIYLEQPSGKAVSGMRAQIACAIKSNYDIIEVRWQRSGSNEYLESGEKYEFKKQHDATLTIHEVEVADAGTYTCFVRNSKGSSKSKPFTLTVIDVKDAKELRHYARVIIVGKEGVGKTSLMQRLLWGSPRDISNIPSTDGIDICITECEIDVENGKWMPYNEATDDLVQRFERACAKQPTKTKTEAPSKIVSEVDESQIKSTAPFIPNESLIVPNQQLDEQRHYDNDSYDKQGGKHDLITENDQSKTSLPKTLEQRLDAYQHLDEQGHYDKVANTTREDVTNKDANNEQGITNHDFKTTEKEQNNTSLPNRIPKVNKQNTNSSSKTVTVVNEKNEELSSSANSSIDNIEKDIDNAASALINSVKDKHATNTSSKTAACWLWDFAGQKDFYATHQAFLSSCAVFLLVVDITDDISKQHYMSEDFQYAGDYIDFWLNSIHCYWSVQRKDKLDPPVIVVCSKDDKLELEKNEDRQDKERKRQHFFDKLFDRLRSEPTKNHIRKIVSISNVEDNDATFDGLRKEIFEQAIRMNDWGREVPLKWIFLEMILQKMKVANVNVTTYEKLNTIAGNKNIGIYQKRELDEFLKTQHAIGNIIYFPSDKLKDYIIVNPKWLVQAFRCLISDKIDVNIKLTADWGELINTGKMTDALFCQLLKKTSDYDFLENKSHLIEVLKQFDILVHLRNEGLSDHMYMPCIVKAGDLETVLNILGHTRTSWLCFEFDFLPPAFFNHIVVSFIKTYSVTEVLKDGKKELGIYRNYAVFDLVDTKDKKIILCVSKNIIGIQIWTSKNLFSVYTDALNMKTMVDGFINRLKQKYSMGIKHTVTCKCDSPMFTNDRWEYSKVSWSDMRTGTYFCSNHCGNHSFYDVFYPWYQNDLTELLPFKLLKPLPLFEVNTSLLFEPLEVNTSLLPFEPLEVSTSLLRKNE